MFRFYFIALLSAAMAVNVEISYGKISMKASWKFSFTAKS